MVQAGDVIENPVTGERITFLRTSTQTGGRWPRWTSTFLAGPPAPMQ